MRMLTPAAVVVMLCCTPSLAAAQAPPPTTAPAWTFSAAAFIYFLPDETNYVQPTVTADRARLHLEARFNYEARDTASVWAGVNFSGGESVEWEFTPMLGGVFGSTDGVAPGYKAWLGWRALELYSEGEAMVDLGDAGDSFFYNWSEITFAPIDWFKFGLVTQRTRAYESDRDIQRGLILRGAFRNLEMTTYILNPDDSKPIVVLAFGISF